MLAIVTLALLFVLVLLRMPVLAALVTTVAFYFVATGGWPLAYPQQVISGIDGFILLALPIFIYAGSLMNAGGLSGHLFELARSLVGPLRGGLAHVNVLISMLFGGLIGTSVADLAGTGSVVIPAMKDDGYPPAYAAALTATSSGIGPLIPPSTPMILYASVTGTSLGTLFIAGIIPGILMAASLMSVIAVQARLRGWQGYAAFDWHGVAKAFQRALLAMGMPLIIVGGIVLGVFTPTEAGAFATVYAGVLALLVYRRINFRQLYFLTVRAAALTGEVMMIVGVSVALGWAMSNVRLPQALAGIIEGIVPGDSVGLRLIAIMVLAVVAGMVLDPLIPIVVPIVFPTVLLFGIDPIHFGILMVLAVVIGQVTPPLAITLIVAGRIADVDLYDVIKANMSFLAALIIFSLILIFAPPISTWLPGILMR